jgi:hypothetical protein
MLYERRVKVKLDLTLQQPFTNVVITLCASWGAEFSGCSAGGMKEYVMKLLEDCDDLKN